MFEQNAKNEATTKNPFNCHTCIFNDYYARKKVIRIK